MPTEQPTFTEEELQQEVWKPVENFPDYDVSNLGRVRSHKGWGRGQPTGVPRILRWGFNAGTGYYMVILYKATKPHSRDVHRLVADHFLGPLPQGYTRNHEDANKQNNRASNLNFKTMQEQMEHAKKLGLILCGDRNPSVVHPERLRRGEGHNWTKLTAQQVLEIRAAQGLQREIALDYGITQGAVHAIKSRKTWKHL